MPKYDKWIERLSEAPYKWQECNCAECQEEQIDYQQLCDEAIADLYPHFHGEMMPRVCDHKTSWLNRDIDLRYRRFNTQDYWIGLLGMLKRTDDRNKIIRREHKHKRMVYCVDCGTLHFEEQHIEIDGVERPVCFPCFDRYYIKCNVCGEVKNSHRSRQYLPDFDTKKWGNGKKKDFKHVCSDCYVDSFMQCSNCNMPLTAEHWINISLLAGHMTETHKIPIILEGQQVWDDEMQEWLPGEDEWKEVERPHVVVCKKCNEGAIVECERCGDGTLRWKMRKIEWRGDVIKVCQPCYDARRVIKAYDYAVRPKFRHADSEPTLSSMLYYGVEVEMEYVAGIEDGDVPHLEVQGQKIMDYWPNDFCYIKHDGTLEYGYEAVTHPFTWPWFMENRDKWIEFLLWLRELGFKSHYYSNAKRKYTCGMHVHMSKEAFTRMHLYKFVHFMYKKSTRPFVNAIAEREGSQYADFQVADSKYAHRVGKDKSNASGHRHSAINLMGGHAHEHGKAPAECQTCEIRIFQGYLEPVKFFKNMEFLHSLYEFTSFNSPRDMQLKKYLEYLVLKPNRFPALLDFIKHNKAINSSYAYVNKLMKGV